MANSRISKILAYIFVPVFFSIIGYLALGFMLRPVYQSAMDTLSFVMADTAPVFDTTLKSIYVPKPKPAVPVETVPSETEEVPEETTPAVPETISIKDIEFPNDGTQYGYITCEDIGLSAPVYWDDTNEVLRNGVGQYIGSFLPGFGRTIILSAHNRTFFEPLEYLQVGQHVTIDTNYDTYVYEIYQIDVLNANNLEMVLRDMVLNEEETLVMYTCYPFRSWYRETDRLVAYGKRISGKDVIWKGVD